MTQLPEAAEIVDAIRAALIKLLSPEDLAQVDVGNLGPQTPLLSLPIDSAALMALMTELEDTFTVFIDEEAAFSFAAVGDVVDHIRNRLAAKAQRLSQA
ncbi:MAG: acyl carrier protein [Mycobacterium sp.]|nr:acyl carrier protein [Mycobacterium sp.]